MFRSYRLQRLFLSILVGLMAGGGRLHACTTVVVSGKATADGRPLLWKNRDTWQRNNEMLHDASGKYAFVGVANAGAKERIRMGCNTAGLCIENSVSRDLAPAVEGGRSDDSFSNGELIREALRTCATVDEFRALLERSNETGRTTRGNFGVIDAAGGAMIFEVGPNRYAAFDANDPDVAPRGYLVRANFSQTALRREGTRSADRDSAYSIERFNRADELCSLRLASRPIELRYLLHAVARDAAGCLRSEFAGGLADLAASSKAFPVELDTSKTLNRGNTVSAVVFQGVLPGEAPTRTTMWTLLGEPLFTIAVPAWADQGGVAPQTNGPETSELCSLAMQLRDRHYDASGGRLNTGPLPRTTRVLFDVENELIDRVEQQMRATGTSAPDSDSLRRLHDRSVDRVTETLRKLLDGLDPPAVSKGSQPISIDFTFDDDADGTGLVETTNSVGNTTWNGGIADCVVAEGAFRIRRNKTSSVNRYISLSPRVRVRGERITYRGYLVVDIRGWNLRGKTLGEQVRFGFSSQGENDYQTAGMVLERTGEDQVTLSGIAFGDGSSSIRSEQAFPAYQPTPVTLVLELDKTKGNPDEGVTGGEYQIYYRREGDARFVRLGDPGQIRRNRNGNEIHLRSAGRFAAENEYFDIDRIYFTKNAPF